MGAKGNALRIIRFDKPECIMSGPPQHGLAYFGANHESPQDGVGHERAVGTHWADIWGTVWYKEHEGVMGFPRGNPLDSPEKLAGYRWPDPDDERVVRSIHEQLATFSSSDEVFLSGSHRDTLWERAYMLVGMENLMVYMYTEPGLVRDVFHRIMDFQMGIARHYLAAGVEMVNCSDDLGTQAGPLMGPDMVGEFLVPEYQRLLGLYHRHGVLINFHSCGNIEAMIPIFLELGIHILNPVQATANDLDKVRMLTQGRVALLGGVSSELLMQGPAERIVQEARRRMRQLGTQGGYFCTADQHMPFPPGHLAALQQAVNLYGRYPLG